MVNRKSSKKTQYRSTTVKKKKNNKAKRKDTRMRRNHSKARKIKLFIFGLIFICSLAVLGFSIYKMVTWYSDNNKIDKLSDEINAEDYIESDKDRVNYKVEQINPPDAQLRDSDYYKYMKMDMLSINFKDLIKKNSETVGWIKVNGTNINYPVVKHSDNKYYLTHAFDKSENTAGWIFMDYRNSSTNLSKNTIIYGHSRLTGTMFGTLKKTMNESWYKNTSNHIVHLSTPTENTMWQVFSIYTIKKEGYYIKTKFTSTSDFKKFVKTIKDRSTVKFNAQVDENDKILTLSTCKGNNDERFVVHAKLIKREIRN